jgi:hypothetical protein
MLQFELKRFDVIVDVYIDCRAPISFVDVEYYSKRTKQFRRRWRSYIFHNTKDRLQCLSNIRRHFRRKIEHET